jgi:hypothetical protein
MVMDMINHVKKEIEWLLGSRFIRLIRYGKGISNIVLVLKKNGKLRVCIDFRNLNPTAPKDEYPMSMTNMLINPTFGNKILSFMDDHSS